MFISVPAVFAQEQNTEEQNTEINNTPQIKHYVITFDNGFYSELSDFKVSYSGHVVEFYKIEIDTITK